GDNEGPPVGRLQRVDERVEVHIAQNVIEDKAGDDDDGEAESHAQSTEADLLVEQMRDGAQSVQHSALPTTIMGSLTASRSPRSAGRPHPGTTAWDLVDGG